MNSIKIFLITMIILSSAFIVSAEDAVSTTETINEDLKVTQIQKERGIYIYDDVEKLTTESKLGLSAFLWKLDVKTGYENVIVFPKEKMTVEQMGEWFNAHGVGKKDINNGITLFIFPDNSAYGMIGSGHDKIAVPFLSTYGARAFTALSKEPVVALLGFSTTLGKKLDAPIITEEVDSFGKTVLINLDIIILGFLIIALFLVLLQQGDGFQITDLIPSAALFVILVFIIGITSIGSEMSSNVNQEYGIITNTMTDSHIITETHSYPCGKRTCYRTDHHTIYTNDVNIISYDFKEYTWRFSSRDSKSSWNIHTNTLVAIETYKNNNRLSWATTQINDNSGGKTDLYGTWIQTK